MDDPKEKLSCGVCGKPAVAVVEGTGAALCASCRTAFALGQQSPARRMKILSGATPSTKPKLPVSQRVSLADMDKYDLD